MVTLSEKISSREAKIKATGELRRRVSNSSTRDLLDEVRMSPNPSDTPIDQDNGSTRRLRRDYEDNRVEEPLPRTEPAKEPNPDRVSDARLAILEDQSRGSLVGVGDPSKARRDEINFSDTTRKNLNPVEHEQTDTPSVSEELKASETKEFRYKVNFSDTLRATLNRVKYEPTVVVPVLDPMLDNRVSERQLQKPVGVNSDLGEGKAKVDNTPGYDKEFRSRIGHTDSYDEDNGSTGNLRGTLKHEDNEIITDYFINASQARAEARTKANFSKVTRSPQDSDTDDLRRLIHKPPTGLGPYLGYALGITNDFLQMWTGPKASNFLNGPISQAPEVVQDAIEGVDWFFNKVKVSPLNKLWRYAIIKRRLLNKPYGHFIKKTELILIDANNKHLTHDGRKGLPLSGFLTASNARRTQFMVVENGVPKNWFEYRMSNHNNAAQLALDRKRGDDRAAFRESHEKYRYLDFANQVREATGNQISADSLKRDDRGMGTPQSPKSPINNVVSIMNMSTPDLKTITLQHRPTEIEVTPESNWVSVNSMGRNNPFVMYTGGNHKISIDIVWFSKEDPTSVINSCRLLESWSKADGYIKAPPLLKIIWGTSGMFDDQTWVLESAPYKLTGFRNGHRKPRTKDTSVGSTYPSNSSEYLSNPDNFVDTKLYPGYATQTLTFKLITGKNLRHLDIIPDEEVDKLCSNGDQQVTPYSKDIKPN